MSTDGTDAEFAGSEDHDEEISEETRRHLQDLRRYLQRALYAVAEADFPLDEAEARGWMGTEERVHLSHASHLLRALRTNTCMDLPDPDEEVDDLLSRLEDLEEMADGLRDRQGDLEEAEYNPMAWADYSTIETLRRWADLLQRVRLAQHAYDEDQPYDDPKGPHYDLIRACERFKGEIEVDAKAASDNDEDSPRELLDGLIEELDEVRESIARQGAPPQTVEWANALMNTSPDFLRRLAAFREGIQWHLDDYPDEAFDRAASPDLEDPELEAWHQLSDWFTKKDPDHIELKVEET